MNPSIEINYSYGQKALAYRPRRNYKKLMKIEFDPTKSDRNVAERGLPFTAVSEFDWSSATFSEDTRKDYPERRFVALGFIGGRLHVVCFTPIDGGVRVISFRKANDREVRRYER